MTETTEGGKGATILVVDDEAEVRALIREVLTLSGYTVIDTGPQPAQPHLCLYRDSQTLRGLCAKNAMHQRSVFIVRAGERLGPLERLERALAPEPSEVREGGVAHDSQQPGAGVATPERLEVPVCTQICLLDRVLGVVVVSQDAPGKGVGRVQVRQGHGLARHRLRLPDRCPGLGATARLHGR